jgi:hypothetical protein
MCTQLTAVQLVTVALCHCKLVIRSSSPGMCRLLLALLAVANPATWHCLQERPLLAKLVRYRSRLELVQAAMVVVCRFWLELRRRLPALVVP